jgi:hypothetical protein
MGTRNSWLRGAFWLLALATAGCFRENVVTITVRVPQLATADQAAAISNALRQVETAEPLNASRSGMMDGLRAVHCDLIQHAVRVTYDTRKLARKNIEYRISDAGFDANEIPARARAPAAPTPEPRGP